MNKGSPGSHFSCSCLLHAFTWFTRLSDADLPGAPTGKKCAEALFGVVGPQTSQPRDALLNTNCVTTTLASARVGRQLSEKGTSQQTRGISTIQQHCRVAFGQRQMDALQTLTQDRDGPETECQHHQRKILLCVGGMSATTFQSMSLSLSRAQLHT